ncbi:MAG: alanine racemase [Firmicutes bacterium]|nr:alanine racemase [Bacillota bacterium]
MPYSLDSVDTPFVAMDLDVVERNLQAMQARIDALGLKLRPHTKTHKQPWLAARQMAIGAHGLTVAKLGEAEVMLEAGFNELLIAYPLVGEAKAVRLAALMARGLKPVVAIDSREALETLARAAAIVDQPIRVLIEVDTGFHRCGLRGPAVIELARAVRQAPRLLFAGLMSYSGHISGQGDPAKIQQIIREEDEILWQHAQDLQACGVPVEIISIGGTVLAHYLASPTHATEVRPGIYVFNDLGIVHSGACRLDDCAARVWSTVVSRPAPDRAILDAGSKMLAFDGPIEGSYGYVVDYPGWHIRRLSEEHAIVEIDAGAPRPDIGQRVAVIPNHICPVINLQDRVVGVRAGQVVSTHAILGRGLTR